MLTDRALVPSHTQTCNGRLPSGGFEFRIGERGTGLEPATSTLGTLRQPSTIVDERLH
jgi:hypothetical protein